MLEPSIWVTGTTAGLVEAPVELPTWPTPLRALAPFGKSLFHPRPLQFRRINPRGEGVTCSQPPGLWAPELEAKPQD